MARRSEATREEKLKLTKAREATLDETLALLHFGFRAIIAGPDALLGRKGLGRVHHRILYFVRKNAGLSVGELLRILAVTKQALHRPLAELVRQGLAERSVDPDNRRIVRLRLSRAGAAFERTLSAAQRAHFARAFAEAGPSAERGFRTVLALLPAAGA
jgi:DNA-binding MarR family transcriptional regulator